MGWLTFRRLRTEIIIVALATAAVALVLIISGAILHAAYAQSGYARCVQYFPSYPGTCGKAYDAFFAKFEKLRGLTPWLNLFPLLTGILLGIPLFAREFEEGTYQFALTQSISRRRWALTQISIPLLIVVFVALVMTALMTWWNAPFDQIESRFGMPSWDFEGLMPLVFGLLAFALSAFASGVLRRTVPAVAATFVYIPLWLLADNWLRTILPPPTRLHYAYQNMPTLSPHDWIIAEGVMDSSGHPVSSVVVGASQQGLQGYVIYQPISSFWLVQGVEAAILIGLAGLLLTAVVWLLSRHNSDITSR